MRHVMVDLETLGTVPGCCILSIGACGFSPSTGAVSPNTFYTAIDTEGQLAHGMTQSPSTLAWWAKQSEEARSVFTDPERKDLPEALTAFNTWLRQFPDVLVYGNGADFDNPILAAAYAVAGVPQGWKAYNGRCYRTLKALAPSLKLVREGTHHNALGDAISQAKHLCAIVTASGGLLNLA